MLTYSKNGFTNCFDYYNFVFNINNPLYRFIYLSSFYSSFKLFILINNPLFFIELSVLLFYYFYRFISYTDIDSALLVFFYSRTKCYYN